MIPHVLGHSTVLKHKLQWDIIVCVSWRCVAVKQVCFLYSLFSVKMKPFLCQLSMCDDIWWNDSGYTSICLWDIIKTFIDVILVVVNGKLHCSVSVLYCMYLLSVPCRVSADIPVFWFHFTIRLEWMLRFQCFIFIGNVPIKPLIK